MLLKKWYHLTGLSASGGILAGLAWSGWFTGLVLLIALVPFFIIEDHFFENHHRNRPNAYFIHLLPGLLIFNTIAVGWVRAASIPAAVTVITGMSFLMAFTMWLAHIIRLRAGNITGAISLVSLWMAFELMTIRIPLLSPWMNLGNGLAKDILFIQWYEVTGVPGGTLWILLSNLFLAAAIVGLIKHNESYRIFIRIWIALIIMPLSLSLIRFYTIRESKGEGYEAVIVQPNIDPFTEKFTVSFTEQLRKVLDMADHFVTSDTRWVITPETTVDDPVNEHLPDTSRYIVTLRKFTSDKPGLAVISGLVSFRLYPPEESPPTSTARRIDTSAFWYDHFNSAFLIDSSGTADIYHKSRLVPGIEMQLSSLTGKFINKIVPHLGGTKWGYGVQGESICFRHPYGTQMAAPVICYESAFGDYVASYVRKGADILCIITNDGWWKNTSGYKQHLTYASLRAIETRRMVARCANTGVSCIIDIRGKITDSAPWWTEAVLKGELRSEKRITPYVRYGDFLYRISAFLSVIILAYVFIGLAVRKKFASFPAKRCNP